MDPKAAVLRAMIAGLPWIGPPSPPEPARVGADLDALLDTWADES